MECGDEHNDYHLLVINPVLRPRGTELLTSV
jgi:hypothetical protein